MNLYYCPVQVSYVVKYHDLKIMDGPVMVRQCRDDIEAQTRDHQVTIEYQWLPHGLEFHIAGLEDGVATALLLIQKELVRCAIVHSTFLNVIC